MKRLHKLGDLILLQINKTENCIHPVLTMSQHTGEKVCAMCGRSIYITGDSNAIDLVISQHKKSE